MSRFEPGPNDQAFQQGLLDLGYVEGQNIVIERRWAGGNPDRLPELAADLVRLNVDVIFAGVQRSNLLGRRLEQFPSYLLRREIQWCPASSPALRTLEGTSLG